MITCKKRGFGGGVPAVSPMIKSTKGGEEKEGSSCSWSCIPFHRGESFYFIPKTLPYFLEG